MLANHYYDGLVEAGCDEAGRGCLAGPVYAAAVILPPDYHNELLNDSKQLSAMRRYELREQIEHDAVAWAVGVVDNKEIDKINILRASILAMHRALDQLNPVPEAIIVDGNRFKAWMPKGRPTEANDVLPPFSLRSLEASQPRSIVGEASGLRSLDASQPRGIVGEASRLRNFEASQPRGIVGEASGPRNFEASRLLHRDLEASTPLPYTTIVKGDGKYLAIAAASILAKTYRDDFMLKIHEEYPMYHWDGNKGYPAKVHRDAIRQYGTTPYHRLTFNLLGESQQLELSFPE